MTTIQRTTEVCGIKLMYVTADPEDTTVTMEVSPGLGAVLNPDELREVAREMLRAADQIDPPAYVGPPTVKPREPNQVVKTP